jgi:Ser/Thr protein kinase RdoA (MazF antagonist)
MGGQGQISNGAVRAAIWVARQLGIDCIDPIILHHSQHVSIRLFPLDVVARVLRAGQPHGDEQLRRELAVARHLVQKAAPVVGPTTEFPAGPHFHDGFGLTLWQFVEHIAADFDNREHAAAAAMALRSVHNALADFPSELPSFGTIIEECRALLEDELALPALSTADRAFLLGVYSHSIAALDALRLELAPIHGDAGAHNVFITPEGARYSDFEKVNLGPREWDIGFLSPDIELTEFEPVNRDALSVLGDLRSLCVSVWCWVKYDMPEKREAAEYHLGYLKERFA